MKKILALLFATPLFAQQINPNTQIARVKVKYVDPASATNLITQVNALFTFCGSNCQVHIPAGTYTVASGTISMTHPGQSLLGDGMKQVTINYAGTNFLDARLNSGTYAAQSSTGAVSGFTLNCSNTAAKCMSGGSWVGFQWGINHDLDIVGPGGLFSNTPVGTSQCLYLQNTFDWYERGSVDLSFEGCAIGLNLDTATGSGTNSYEYNQFNITSSLGLGATAVKIGASAQVEHFRSFHLQFNVNGNGSGAQPVIFDIGSAAILNGGDGVIVGEGGSQPYTMAHIRTGGGFVAVEGSITTFATPTYVIDALGTGSYPWNWGPAGDNGLLYSTAGPPVLTSFPLTTSTNHFDVHAAHLGSLTANSDYMEGMLQDTTNGFSTPFRAGNANEYICDANYNSFSNLNSLTARDCVDGSGNFFPMGAYQLVGPNGPTSSVFTKSAVAADGDVVLATGTSLAGYFLITFVGPNRQQYVEVQVGVTQFDTNASLIIPVNYSYLTQQVLTNFRIVENGGGSPQLVATIGNRNAGTQLTVTPYGNAVFTSSLLPGGAIGTTAVTNTGRPAVPGIPDGCGTWASGIFGSTGSACGSGGSGNTTSTALTTNRVPKANGANSIIDSSVSDDGTTVSTPEAASVLSLTLTDAVNNSQDKNVTGSGGDSTCVPNTTSASYTNCIKAGIPQVSIGPSGGWQDYLILSGTGTGGNLLNSSSTAGQAVDSGIASNTVVTLTGTQTVINKTIDGVTPATMAFVDPTSSVQTQLNAKAPVTCVMTNNYPCLNTNNIFTGTTDTFNAVAVTTLTASGAITATSDGVHAGYLFCVGNTTNPAVPANSFGIICPASASFTSYAWQPSATAPSGTQFVTAGTPAGNASPINYVSASGTGSVCLTTNCALTTPSLGTPTALTLATTTTTNVPFRAVSKVSGSAQAANISSATLVTAPASTTEYEICWYAVLTQAATSSSTMPSVTISWNDATDHVSRTINLSGYNSSSANATFVAGSQCGIFNVQASTAVGIVGTGYGSVGATPMQYAYTINAEVLP